MNKRQKKKRLKLAAKKQGLPQLKSFLDMIAPTAVQFNTDSYILGSTYRCAMAVRKYPSSTEELALLRHIGDKSGVLLRIYCRMIPAMEGDAIIQAANNKNKLDRSNTNNLKQSVTAEANLQDVVSVINAVERRREPLVCCAVFLELCARSQDTLRALKEEVRAELLRSKMGADSLLLRQREGFLSANPAGGNAFRELFERVFPVSSVGDLFPFNFSGKTDPHGFYIGRDRYGSNMLVDLDRRAEDKTNGSALILGNSGQGKSFLLKLLLTNIRLGGKSVLAFDPEHELKELSDNLGGCFIDLMAGQYKINPLEPKMWDTGSASEVQGEDEEAPSAFRQNTRLSQHISFLKDFFRAYKSFSDLHIDTIELMLERMYAKFGINDNTDFSRLRATDYPIFSDLYDVMEEAYKNYDRDKEPLYTQEMLREIMLGLHSLCRGAESRFFNGHTNITSSKFLVFGVKGLLNAGAGVRDAMLFNVLSYFSDQMLSQGDTTATLDELHVWLSNKIAIEYIRNVLKRARKKNSSLIMASQNLEDFLLPGVAEFTKPLFAIPAHQFLFNAGAIDKRPYMESLQLEENEYRLIKEAPQRVCLYKCGSERFLLEVRAPEHKRKLWGSAGGT